MNRLNEYTKPLAAVCMVLAIILVFGIISVAGSVSKDGTSKGDKKPGVTTPQKSEQTTPSSSTPPTTDKPVVTPRGIKICIDAGHGWADKGTNSRVTDEDGKPYYESDITLEISKKLRDKLEAMGFDVVMIRENDTDISPAGIAADNICNITRRVEWINKQDDIDLMISIHCDSFSDSSVNGARIYYNADTHPETNLLGNGIAASLLDGGASSRFPILYDDSTRLFSLKNSKMPSILVECGFMTSDTDIANLIDPTYQGLFAECLANAISNYYSDAAAA